MSRTPWFRRSAALVGVVGLLSVAACSGPSDDSAEGPTGEGTSGSIELPRVSTLVAYPALPSGLEEGLFDEPFGADASGMSVDFVSSGNDGVLALVAGHTDIVIGGFDPTTIEANPGLRIVAVTEQSPDTHAVLVSPDSDIESIADLEGKTVGGFSTSLAPFLAMMLQREDMPADSINYIQVAPDGGLSALSSGAIDAWYTWDPFFAQAELTDRGRAIVTGEDFFLNPIVMVTTEDYIAEHGDSLAAFIQGYDASTTWVNENTDAAEAYLVSETGMTAEAAAVTIERRVYEVQEPSDETITWMETSTQTLVDLGVLPDLPDIRAALDPEPLRAALEG
ncbi:hypothetical protein C8046_11425 [Serinibacter arcticus]|uniref:SsuA/THI5-like domain-containing protein n=1 Tax=Serinibacter arcticus TaxID=1655435 RepID=A0A2U1ZVZ9_9MICO|nr:ABC transporter substrate-binding protein [Serinibacter arcticus]PWD51166.1 hypothetical protein C8046_11425 [Serinibacter arcticus]